jgi:phage tail-like protein
MAIISRNQRAYGAGKYGISIDGTQNAGWLSSVEGGNAVADVITEKIGGDWLQKKHLGNVKFEEVSFQCGTGMSSGLYNWIDTGFKQNSNAQGRKNGAIHFCDYDYVEIARLEWQFGLMTEVGMPALDAAGKDAAKMSIKFNPETTKRINSASSSIVNTFPIQTKSQKQWTNANFRLRIDGLPGDSGDTGGACSRVNKIDALTVKQKVTENSLGEFRHYEKEPTSVEIPNLVLTVAESHSAPFYDWHQTFVIDGNCGEGQEKQGELVYLAADTTTPLFHLYFVNLGIFKVTPDKMEAGNEGIRRTKVEMYCEDIRFQYEAAATWGGPSGSKT